MNTYLIIALIIALAYGFIYRQEENKILLILGSCFVGVLWAIFVPFFIIFLIFMIAMQKETSKWGP